MENKIKKFQKANNLENSKLAYKKIESQLDFLLEGQEINQKELRLGFIGLAKQNQELLELNKQLSQQLETVVEELNILKKERKEKVARAQARANRKRLPKRDPMTRKIYKELIQAAEGPTYLNVSFVFYFCIIKINLKEIKCGHLFQSFSL